MRVESGELFDGGPRAFLVAEPRVNDGLLMRKALIAHGLCLRFGAAPTDCVGVAEISVTSPAAFSQRRSVGDEFLHHRDRLGYVALVN